MTPRSASPISLRRLSPAPDARRRRIERELRALHLMDGRLRTGEIVCALAAIPGLGLLWLLVFLKLQWLSGHAALALGASLALGALVWCLGRRVLWLAGLIVLGLLLVVFESLDGLDLPDLPEGRKARRRMKLERAIRRRDELLARLPA